MGFSLNRPQGTTRTLSALEESALKEVGNIIIGSYFTVLGNRLQMRIIEHVPNLSTDMFGAILDSAISTLAAKTDKALLVEIQFTIASLTVTGQFLFLLAIEAIEAIVKALAPVE